MKKSIIFSAAIIVLGAFIAFGPQFLFPVCDPAMPATATTVSNAESAEDAAAAVVDDCCAVPEESDCCGTSQKSYPVCHWSARAELGLGFLIIALGLCMLVFCDPKTQLGLALGTFFASFIAIAIPNALIGVILFHLLFLVAPMAGKNLIGSAMLGEYFRQFVSYGVIALALVLYEWKRAAQEDDARALLRGGAGKATL